MTGLGVLAVVIMLVLASCGPEGDLVQSRPVISHSAGAPELGSSPARTALQWWAGLRARDAEAVVAGLTPTARRTVDMPELRQALRGRFGQGAEGWQANVLYTERRADRATVYMRIDGGLLVGSRLIEGGAQMLALPLVARDGAWLIENATWLNGSVSSSVAIEKFNEQLHRQSMRRHRQVEQEGK
jgi:hypothetical protein